jgi:uncharacterized protein (TIGR03066 family)
MHRFMLSVAALLLVATCAFAQDKVDAKLLIGKWEPDGGDTKGAKIVLEFTDKGEMLVNAEFGGQKMDLKGSYKLDGDKLEIKLKNPTGTEKATSLKVVKLTKEELITKEGDQKEEKMKRVK